MVNPLQEEEELSGSGRISSACVERGQKKDEEIEE